MLPVFVLCLVFIVRAHSQQCSPGYGLAEDVYTIILQHRHCIKSITYGGAGSNVNQGSVISVVAGQEASAWKNDGIGTNARFNGLNGMVLIPDTKIFIVSDTLNSKLRQVDFISKSVTTILNEILVGSYPGNYNGIPPDASIAYPYSLTYSRQLAALFVGAESTIKRVTYPSIRVSSPAIEGYDPQNKFYNSMSFDGSFMIITNPDQGIVQRLDISSSNLYTIAGSWSSQTCADGVGTNALFTKPTYSVITKSGSDVYVADPGVFTTIRKINLSTLKVSCIMGVCPAISDGLWHSLDGLVLSPDETYLLFMDGTQNTLRRIDVTGGNLMTINPSSGLGYSFSNINFMMLIPGQSSSCNSCESGKYSLGDSSCTTCPIGFFCQNTSIATRCPSGKF